MKTVPLEVDQETRNAFLAKIRKVGECWEWQGTKQGKGYGYFYGMGETYLAHRFSYTMHKGKIPDGLTLDHLCRNKGCVNPDHLEPVTNLENNMRGEGICARRARATRCSKGHPLSGENVYMHMGRFRCCRICKKKARHEYWSKHHK